MGEKASLLQLPLLRLVRLVRLAPSIYGWQREISADRETRALLHSCYGAAGSSCLPVAFS